MATSSALNHLETSTRSIGYGSHEVVLVPEGDGGIDPHAALEPGIGCRPLLVASSHSLGGLEGLADSARNRVEDVGVGVNARRQAPDNVVHRVDINVGVDRDCEAHALAHGERGGQEVALPALLDLVALLDLDDATAPVGHAEGDVDVLHDAWLQPLAELENG